MSLETDLADLLAQANALSPEDRRYRNLVAMVANIRQALGGDGGTVGPSNPVPIVSVLPSEFTPLQLATDQTIVAATTATRKIRILNFTDKAVWLKYGTTAVTSTNYDFVLDPQAWVEHLRIDEDWMGEMHILGDAPATGRVLVNRFIS